MTETHAVIDHSLPFAVTWSADDIAELKQRIWGDQTVAIAAQRMGRSVNAVRNKCYELGLKTPKVWTDARIEKLKQLHGLSATQAGEVLGMTRNAVIGKRHRLGLESGSGLVNGRSQHIGQRKPRRKSRRMATLVPQFIPEEITELPADQSECAVTFAELAAHHCRWPLAQTGMSCGADKLDGCSYCLRHAARAFQSPHSRGRVHFSLRERTA